MTVVETVDVKVEMSADELAVMWASEMVHYSMKI